MYDQKLQETLSGLIEEHTVNTVLANLADVCYQIAFECNATENEIDAEFWHHTASRLNDVEQLIEG